MSPQWLQRNKCLRVEVNVRTGVLCAAVSLSLGISLCLSHWPHGAPGLPLIVPLQYIILDFGENSHEKSLSLISLLTFSLCSLLE